MTFWSRSFKRVRKSAMRPHESVWHVLDRHGHRLSIAGVGGYFLDGRLVAFRDLKLLASAYLNAEGKEGF